MDFFILCGGQHIVWQLLKISHLNFWHFLPIFVLSKPTCLVTLFDRKLQVFKNSPKWTILGISNKLLSTQNVIKLASLAMLNETFSVIFKHREESAFMYSGHHFIKFCKQVVWIGVMLTGQKLSWTNTAIMMYWHYHSTTLLVIHHVCQRMPSKPLFSTSIESRSKN